MIWLRSMSKTSQVFALALCKKGRDPGGGIEYVLMVIASNAGENLCDRFGKKVLLILFLLAFYFVQPVKIYRNVGIRVVLIHG